MLSNDVGVLALELYFPRYYVSQSDLEASDGCIGKYTNGLGQESLGICSVQEDIASISLTVMMNLVKRYKLNLQDIGFLEVGTETLIDKSKSVKTVLLQMFESCGNLDVEGVDAKNACFGGTAAIFHAINWLESSYWDGRLALVIAADIAVYGSKSTRPTGGAGAVAILLGPDAPLVFDRGLRAHHGCHRYDFYKANLSSEYPLVDGPLSITCYKEALIACYRKYKTKVVARGGCAPVHPSSPPIPHAAIASSDHHNIDYLCFHSPFTRLVQKSFAWLSLEDAISCNGKRAPDKLVTSPISGDSHGGCASMDGHLKDGCTALSGQNSLDSSVLLSLKSAPLEDFNRYGTSTRELDNLCVQATKAQFTVKVKPGLLFARQIGNMYTASLYACLFSLMLTLPEEELRGRRILLFSYGSGLMSAMFSLVVHPTRCLGNVLPSVEHSPLSGDGSVTHALLNDRVRLSVPQFEEILAEREGFHNAASITPVHRPEGLFPGTYYLHRIDERYQRVYKQMPFS